jgi:hypothetical protein
MRLRIVALVPVLILLISCLALRGAQSQTKEPSQTKQASLFPAETPGMIALFFGSGCLTLARRIVRG